MSNLLVHEQVLACNELNHMPSRLRGQVQSNQICSFFNKRQIKIVINTLTALTVSLKVTKFNGFLSMHNNI
jgi:hypothetical protein